MRELQEVNRFFSTNRDTKTMVSSVLWGDVYWMEKIFDRAAGVLCVEKRKGGKVQWNIAYGSDDRAMFGKDDAWIGINLYAADRPHRRNAQPATVITTPVTDNSNEGNNEDVDMESICSSTSNDGMEIEN